MAQYHCNYCQENILDLRVKCGECTDFDLCLQCFSCGAESGHHKQNHRYQLIDDGSFPIFGASHAWKAKEELALLDAVEQYGFGNWEDIAGPVATKSADEVEAHYCDMYVMGNIGKGTWPSDVKLRPTDHTHTEGSPLSPGLNTTASTLELTAEEQQQLGYLPHRDDFEREYENDAESHISTLIINPDDEDIDIDLKLAQIDVYSNKVKERLRRKRIAKDYTLVPQFFTANKKDKSQNNKKKTSREEKEFQERTRSLTQFHSAEEHQQLFESMRKEKELKSRIKELMRYRRNGITKLSECTDFDSARYKRERKKENKKKPFDFFLGEQWILPPKINGVKKTRRKKRRKFSTKRGTKPRIK